jgi:hypothetical protein
MNSSDFLYKTTQAYEEISSLYKVSYIRKLPDGKYRVFSSKGKNMGTYSSREAAKKRLKQIEYFKYLKKIKKKASDQVDLTKIEDFSYSAIMRKINKQLGEEGCKYFAQLYKDYFDQYLLNQEQDIEERSLSKTVKEFNKKYPVKISKKFVKVAAANLGDAATVARYLANIIKFTLTKISPQSRSGSLYKVKNKINQLDVNQISNKKMPASASMGQSITFIKHTLFGQDPQYIRAVLQYIMRYL